MNRDSGESIGKFSRGSLECGKSHIFRRGLNLEMSKFRDPPPLHPFVSRLYFGVLRLETLDWRQGFV